MIEAMKSTMPGAGAANRPPPAPCLRDSHISEAPSVFDGVELGEASEHDDRAWLAVVTGPAAEPCEDPCGIGKRAGRMGILLLGGLALEALTDSLKGRLVTRVDNVAERAFGFALALVDEPHHLDGGDQNGGDEFFERTVLFLPQRFDVEALGRRSPWSSWCGTMARSSSASDRSR